MKKIQLIVEGHGEVAAAPVLLRRLIAAAEAWEIDIGRPIRRNRGQLVKQSELEQSVRLALLQPGCGAVLIMFDGDRARRNWDQPCISGRSQRLAACRVKSLCRTGNTKHGSCRQSSR